MNAADLELADMTRTDEDLEERIGQADEAAKLAAEVVSELEKDPDGELDVLIRKAKEVQDDLSTAASVEKVEDFDINIKSADKNARELAEELKRAKSKAKRDELPETVEVIEEALSFLRGVRKEIDELEEQEKKS